jgi:tRNA pseudouridine55 synthase
VYIESLALAEWSSPDATLDVVCGKGTYIRALAADLGSALLCGAHLIALRRTESGDFGVNDSITLAALEATDAAARDALLLPVDASVVAMPRLDVDADAGMALQCGRAVESAGVAPGRYRCYAAADFIGMVDVADHTVRAARLTRTA